MNIRMKFKKHGCMKFIGHLDIMRYFQKAIRRADIDIAYSEGFSPHMIMSFAAPLGVGLTSEGEYVDLQVNSCVSSKAAVDALNCVMVEGMEVVSFKLLPETVKNAMASVAAADYLVTFRDTITLPADWKEKLTSFYAQDSITVTKKTKKSEKEIDLKEGIYALEIRGEQVYLLLDAGSGSNIKPGFVLETFLESIGVSVPEFAFQIYRLETYKRTKKGKLLPLIS